MLLRVSLISLYSSFPAVCLFLTHTQPSTLFHPFLVVFSASPSATASSAIFSSCSRPDRTFAFSPPPRPNSHSHPSTVCFVGQRVFCAAVPVHSVPLSLHREKSINLGNGVAIGKATSGSELVAGGGFSTQRMACRKKPAVLRSFTNFGPSCGGTAHTRTCTCTRAHKLLLSRFPFELLNDMAFCFLFFLEISP